MEKIAAFLLLSSLVAVPAGAGPLEDGYAAYARGDYSTAARLWRPLAEHGDDRAQYFLGNMYAEGKGVAQDDREAERWYRMAAEHGEVYAQVNLGSMYANGQGVPKDYVQAYMWWNLAAEQGDETASKNRESVTRLMTPAQIAEAQALSGNWKPKE